MLDYLLTLVAVAAVTLGAIAWAQRADPSPSPAMQPYPLTSIVR